MVDRGQAPNLLLNYLRKQLNKPNLRYSSPPQILGGGYSTHMFKFQLSGAPYELSSELVLRLFRSELPPQAQREGLIQNHLLKSGYPCPKTHFICTDKSLLGGEFTVMDFIKGKTLIESLTHDAIPKVARLMAEAHVKLHKVDPTPLIEALEFNNISREFYDGTIWIDWIIESRDIKWLKPGVKWIKENQPEDRRRSICHIDFHPVNILLNESEITGVLDWELSRIGEPERDVATSKIMMTNIFSALYPTINWSDYVEKYVNNYLRKTALDLEKLRYYEGVHCINCLEYYEEGIEVVRLPGVKEGLIDLFKDCSGIEL
jgi:aminoglycoside phosphotransferase (APT) family kinase protein